MNFPVSTIQPSWHKSLQSLCPALAFALPFALPFSASALTWPTAATPEQALTQAVSQWVATQQGVNPTSVRLAPLDARLQIKACESGLRLDTPFAGQETVRVRCEAPTWQLFVRVLAATPTAATPARANHPAGSATGTAPTGADDKSAVMRKVVVANGLLQRGARVSADQLSLVEMPANRMPLNALDRIDDALNAELLRDVPGGTPLRSQDLRPALMVKRGQMVMLSAGSASGFKVVARLEALQDGRMGEQIKLKNKDSGRQISAVVTGLNAADAL